MAKELAMVENNNKGKEARRYFIAMEKKAKAQTPTTYIEALKALVASEEAKAALEAQNATLNTLIDNEFGYCSILRAASYAGVHETEFSWRALKAMSAKLGMEVKKVPSPRYKYQNLYPIRAFELCYPNIDFDGLAPEKLDNKALVYK